MKRIISLFLSITMIISSITILPLTVNAIESSGKCGNNVTYNFNSANGELTISGSGNMTDYTYGGSPFSANNTIRSIIIEDGVTSIGVSAFYYCINLYHVEISDTVVKIGNEAFKDCHKLDNVVLPDCLISIGNGAFQTCRSIYSMNIPESVEKIGSGAFEACAGMKSITVKDNNNYYCSEDGVLFNKNKTELIQYPASKYSKEYVIPNSVETISNGAFNGSGSVWNEGTNIDSIVIPESVKTIGVSAFANCRRIKEIRIPENVEKIGEAAFFECACLKEIIVSENNRWYSSNKGVLFNASETELVQFPIGSDNANCVIPENVSKICRYAFYDATKIETVTVPKSLKSIGNYAFRYCTKISDVYYNGSETDWKKISIGSENTPLTRANIHFCYDRSLSGVIRSGETWSLNWQIDYVVDDFENRYYPKLNIFLKGADSTCNSIMMYSELENAFEMPWLSEEYGFSKDDFISISIKGGNANKLEIISNQFSGYSNVHTVTLQRVRIICSGAFENCKRLKNVTYDQFLQYVGASTFKNDSKLVSFSTTAFVSNITDVGNNAFENTNLNGIFLTNCQNIGSNAFANTPITELTLGRNTTSIGNDAFWGCKDLVLCCYKNSVAYNYALNNNIKYVILDPELDDFLSTDSTDYNNSLATIAAELSLKTYSGGTATEIYLYDFGFRYDHMCSNNYGGSLAYTIGTREYRGADSDGNTDVIVIAAQGSTNPYELFNDSFSPADQNYDGYHVYGIVNDFRNAIMQDLNKFIKDGKRYKVLLTGHSLGGAAVNLLGAQMTKQFGKDNVFCYSFGAINSIVSSKPVTEGYENIHNIYNELDTFSPYQFGGGLKNGAGKKYGKFGHIDAFVKEYRSESDKHKDPIIQMLDHINHDMDKYLDSVKCGFVQNSYLRSCRNGVNKYSIVACPVDVEVYCDNQLVGKTEYNEVDETLNGVDIYVEDDIKIIVYPDNKTYDLNIVSYASGEMTYITQDSEDSDKSSVIQSINLDKNKTFGSVVDDESGTDGVRLYVFDDDGNSVARVLEDGTENAWEPHTHNYEVVSNVNPTCTESGYSVYACTYCEDSYISNYVNDLGHTWNNGVVTIPATEEAEGVKTFTCTRCGETKTEAIPMLSHTHSYTSVVTAPTCTTGGYTTYTCSGCSDSYIAEETAALGHSWNSGVVAIPATEETEGVKTFTCIRCGNTRTEAIPKLTHVHYYTSVVRAPTCTTGGYTTYTCSVCSNSYIGNETAATGHKIVADKAVSATFKAAGKTEGKHCSVCGMITVAQKSVAKLVSPTVSKLTAGKKAFTATWKKAPTVAGYQIQYSLKSNFSGAKSVTIKKDSTTKTTVKKLKAKKKYFVRIRAYKTIDGKKVYSSWSKSKTVTTKK